MAATNPQHDRSPSLREPTRRSRAADHLRRHFGDPAVKRLLPAAALVVVVALAAGIVIGRLTGDATGALPAEGEPGVAADGHIHGGGGDTSAEGPLVTGQSMSLGGYTFVPDTDRFEPGPAQFTFHISDGFGTPVTDYTVLHDKPMHLFAMRLDLSGYQHVHPDMSDDGTWTIELDFTRPGPWRVIADFAVTEGETARPVTLGVDVTVPGDYRPVDLPEPVNPVSVGGDDVSVDFTPTVRVTSPLLVTIAVDGRPAQLEPYLGAFGHLVALRTGDVGFLHVHPDVERVGDALRFWLTIPSRGDYRLYLEFKTRGEVKRAEFTLHVP